MKNLNLKSWNIVAIVIGCLFLSVYLLHYLYSYLPQIRFFGIIFWVTIVLYIFLTTYWLYKEEWRNVLGLSQKNITAKIKWKSFRTGFFISLIFNGIILIILLVFKLRSSQTFGDDMTFFDLFLSVVIVAPIAEEIFFRGFLQGFLEKNYGLNEKRRNIRIIIILIALLFSMAHIRYIIYGETVQWILILTGIFIMGLYLGYLRNKYQSIVPGIFAHFGFNTVMFVVGPILIIFVSVFQPDGWGKLKQKMNQMEFKNDSIYNFDPNDHDILFKAQQKFFAFHNPPHPEFKQHIKEGRCAVVHFYYDIDTNGFITNIRLDSLNLHDFTGSEVAEAALRLVESFPQHKPYIKDGKKADTTFLSAMVPIYY